MVEYSKHIEEYLNYSQANFSKVVSFDEWGDTALAEEYLRKYWLSEKEYLEIWHSIKNSIFLENVYFPDMIYKQNFNTISLVGGCLFLQDDFERMQKAMQEMGERNFVVIQHSQDFNEGEPMFKMKFPVDITWAELTSGNYISSVLLEMNYNQYYVFSENGNWGKYAASDYDFPLDVFGYKPVVSAIFEKYFVPSKKELEELDKWLPKAYK